MSILILNLTILIVIGMMMLLLGLQRDITSGLPWSWKRPPKSWHVARVHQVPFPTCYGGRFLFGSFWVYLKMGIPQNRHFLRMMLNPPGVSRLRSRAHLWREHPGTQRNATGQNARICAGDPGRGKSGMPGTVLDDFVCFLFVFFFVWYYCTLYCNYIVSYNRPCVWIHHGNPQAAKRVVFVKLCQTDWHTEKWDKYIRVNWD